MTKCFKRGFILIQTIIVELSMDGIRDQGLRDQSVLNCSSRLTHSTPPKVLISQRVIELLQSFEIFFMLCY